MGRRWVDPMGRRYKLLYVRDFKFEEHGWIGLQTKMGLKYFFAALGSQARCGQ